VHNSRQFPTKFDLIKLATLHAMCQSYGMLGQDSWREILGIGNQLGKTGVAVAMAWNASAAVAAMPADPEGSGVIIGALNWLQGTLLGTVATVAAVIAIAAVGFMMLTGRINWRHGAVVILGCFILFGAASIVAGIRAAATGG
jgi:type IV secretory pathway VirB2 component (pilin)